MYCNGLVHPVTKETITQYRKLIKDPLLRDLWLKAIIKERHCLAQGCTGITKGTNTIFFLSYAYICNIPSDRTVTYTQIVIDHRPQKEDPNRVCITVRGNLIDYSFEVTLRTADMVSSKILWNSVISTKDARFSSADIKNMYFKIPLDQFEYMKIPIALLWDDKMNIINFKKKSLMATTTWRSAKECTDCHRSASWPTNSSRNNWRTISTLSNRTHPEYGKMSLTRCGSTYVWTILVLSILEENIFNIYMMHYKRKHKKFGKIGWATYIVGLY